MRKLIRKLNVAKTYNNTYALIIYAILMLNIYMIGHHTYIQQITKTKQIQQRIEAEFENTDIIAKNWANTQNPQKFIDSIKKTQTPLKLKPHKISLYLYHKDTLKYWANNNTHTELISHKTQKASLMNSEMRTTLRFAHEQNGRKAIAALNLKDRNQGLNHNIFKYTQDINIQNEKTPNSQTIKFRNFQFYITDTILQIPEWLLALGWLAVVFLCVAIKRLTMYNTNTSNILSKISTLFLILTTLRLLIDITGIPGGEHTRGYGSAELCITMMMAYLLLESVYRVRHILKLRIGMLKTHQKVLCLSAILTLVCGLTTVSYDGMVSHIRSTAMNIDLLSISGLDKDTIVYLAECAFHAGVLYFTMRIVGCCFSSLGHNIMAATICAICLGMSFFGEPGNISAMILISLIVKLPVMLRNTKLGKSTGGMFIACMVLISTYIATFTTINVNTTNTQYAENYALNNYDINQPDRNPSQLRVAQRGIDTVNTDSRYNIQTINTFLISKSDTVFHNQGLVNAVVIQSDRRNSTMASMPYAGFREWFTLWCYTVLWLTLLTGASMTLGGVNIITAHSHRSAVYKMQWVLFGGALISMTIIALVIYGQFYTKISDNIKDEMSRKTVQVQESFDRAMINAANQKLNYNRTIEHLKQWSIGQQTEEGLEVIIYDSASVMVHSDKRHILNGVLPDYVNDKFKDKKTNYLTIIGNPQENSHSITFLRETIKCCGMKNHEITLAVLLSHNKTSEFGLYMDRGLSATIVIILILSVVATQLLYRVITKPVTVLNSSLLGLKDMKKIQVDRTIPIDNEVGVLIQQYNQLLDFFGTRYMAIASSEQDLAWRRVAQQVAHDVKNPLTPMRIRLQMLEITSREDPQAYANKVDETVKMVLNQIEVIINTLNQLSDTNRHREKKTLQINLVELINSTTDFYAKPMEINLQLELGENRTVMVVGDGRAYSRVLMNLLKNAVEAIEGVGKITIKLRITQHFAIMEVLDTGGGIPLSILDNIFTPDITTKAYGTGVGLTICRGIMESFGGGILAGNRDDGVRGACFTVRFPLVAGQSFEGMGSDGIKK